MRYAIAYFSSKEGRPTGSISLQKDDSLENETCIIVRNRIPDRIEYVCAFMGNILQKICSYRGETTQIVDKIFHREPVGRFRSEVIDLTAKSVRTHQSVIRGKVKVLSLRNQ
jgi:hypothetical protein